jgi:hypothetical protein
VTELRQHLDNFLSAIIERRQAPTSSNTKETLTLLPTLKAYGISLEDRRVHKNLSILRLAGLPIARCTYSANHLCLTYTCDSKMNPISGGSNLVGADYWGETSLGLFCQTMTPPSSPTMPSTPNSARRSRARTATTDSSFE